MHTWAILNNEDINNDKTVMIMTIIIVIINVKRYLYTT